MIGLNGAAQMEKIIDGLSSPVGIAFHNDKLFVVESMGDKVSYFYVDGNSPVSNDAVLSLEYPVDVTVSDGKLFISEFGSLFSYPKVLYVDLNNLGLGAKKIIIGEKLEVPIGIASQEGIVFIAESNGDKISKIDYRLEKPRKSTVVTGVYGPSDIVLLDDYIYFTEQTSGMISRKYIYDRSTVSKEIILSKVNSPEGIAINGNYLYFSSNSDNKISRIDISRGITAVVETVVTVHESGARIAFRNNEMYISQRSEGAVYKMNLGVLGIDNFSSNEDIKLHPNPTSDVLNLNNIKNGSEIIIYNLQGKNMLSTELYRDEKIDVSRLETGTYLLTIEGTETIRYIKE